MEKLHSAVHYEHYNIIMLMFKINNYRTNLLTLLFNETNKKQKYKFIYNCFHILKQYCQNIQIFQDYDHF